MLMPAALDTVPTWTAAPSLADPTPDLTPLLMGWYLGAKTGRLSFLGLVRFCYSAEERTYTRLGLQILSALAPRIYGTRNASGE